MTKKKVTQVKETKISTRKAPDLQSSVRALEACEAVVIIDEDDIIDLTMGASEKKTTTTNYERTQSRSVLQQEYYLSKPMKLALSDDEQKLVKYVLSNPEDRDAHEICHFPEMKIRRYELQSLKPRKNLYNTIVDAFSHLLNKEDIKKNGRVTRFCFQTSVADAVRIQVENGVEIDELDDNQMKFPFDLDELDYLQGVSWEACEYVFFPIHGGERFEHYWTFAIDLKRQQFLCLNSMKCEELFMKEPCYYDSGKRLMSHARTFIQARTGKDISEFEWVVPEAPTQPDLKSCGVFVINFMQHFDGQFTPEQKQWAKPKLIEQHRVRMLLRLVTSPDNALLPQIVDAAEAWDMSLGRRGKQGRKKQH